MGPTPLSASSVQRVLENIVASANTTANTTSVSATVDLATTTFEEEEDILTRSLSPELSAMSFELGVNTHNGCVRTSTPAPVGTVNNSVEVLEMLPPPSPTGLQDGQVFDSSSDRSFLESEAAARRRSSKKRKVGSRSGPVPAATVASAAAAAATPSSSTGGRPPHGRDQGTSFVLPPVAASMSTLDRSTLDQVEATQMLDMLSMLNFVVIKREVQLRAFVRCRTGKIVLGGRLDESDNKIYYTIPSQCPNLYVKVSTDIDLRSIDSVVLNYNVSAQGRSERICFSNTALTRMIVCLKEFRSNPMHVEYIEHMFIGTMNRSVLAIWDRYNNKKFLLDLSYLEKLLDVLLAASTFVITFSNYLSHRDRIVNNYYVKLVQQEGFNTNSRSLNVLRFLTLYNDHMNENNINCPWDYLVYNVVDRMMNCCFAHS